MSMHGLYTRSYEASLGCISVRRWKMSRAEGRQLGSGSMQATMSA